MITLPVLAPEPDAPKRFVEPLPDADPEDTPVAPPDGNVEGAATAATASATDGAVQSAVMAEGLIAGMTFHQTDEMVSIQLTPVGGAVTASLAFEAVAIGPVRTHRCTVTLPMQPSDNESGHEASGVAVVFAFDIELDPSESRCVDADDCGAVSGEGGATAPPKGKIVILLRKAVAVQLQRMRVGTSVSTLKEVSFLTKENIEAAKAGTELWASKTQPTVSSIQLHIDADGDSTVEIDICAETDAANSGGGDNGNAAVVADDAPGATVEDAMAKGLRDMFARKEGDPSPEGGRDTAPKQARDVADPQYAPFETARLNVYADATAEMPAGPGTPVDGNQTEAASAPAPNPDFSAAAEFQGSRPGFVFRSGNSGLGYYRDTPPVVMAAAPAAAPVRLTNTFIDELE